MIEVPYFFLEAIDNNGAVVVPELRDPRTLNERLPSVARLIFQELPVLPLRCENPRVAVPDEAHMRAEQFAEVVGVVQQVVLLHEMRGEAVLVPYGKVEVRPQLLRDREAEGAFQFIAVLIRF